MTAALALPRAWRVRRVALLVALGVVLVLVAILAPEAPDTNLGGLSARSTAGGGARMMFELAQRMGWSTRERDVPFEASPSFTVEVELSPSGAVGEREVHRLLEHVRAGGGLVFDAPGNEELVDSLGILVGVGEYGVAVVDADECPAPSGLRARAELAFPPALHRLRWRRPPPGEVTAIGGRGPQGELPFGLAFPLGRGRVVAMASSEVFANDAVRRCGWGADVAVARALEYVRPIDRPPVLEFDEYHHGYGLHPGSVTAIANYLSRTQSGRFLGEALLAGILLVFANAARPVPPRDADRVVRRSPLEHADALARAYADVGATRTAAQRLVSGMRRRVGRAVPVSTADSDAEFLAAIGDRFGDVTADVRLVQHALTESTRRDGSGMLGAALERIERRIESTLSART